MGEIMHHGKPAVKVNAKKIVWSNTAKSAKYNIDGDEEWVPHSLCTFTKNEEYTRVGDIPGTLVIQEWFYNKLFPNG